MADDVSIGGSPYCQFAWAFSMCSCFELSDICCLAIQAGMLPKLIGQNDGLELLGMQQKQLYIYPCCTDTIHDLLCCNAAQLSAQRHRSGLHAIRSSFADQMTYVRLVTSAGQMRKWSDGGCIASGHVCQGL